MLNFKKGLAIVLAAATAFTFAPVANLGVTAQAAVSTVEQTLTIPAEAYTTNGTTTGSVATVEKPGYTQIIPELSADGMKITGLKVMTKNNTTGDNLGTKWYRIAETTGSIDSIFDIDATTDATKYAVPRSTYFTDTKATKTDAKGLHAGVYVKSVNGIIDLGYAYLHAGGTSTIFLVDLGQSGNGTVTDGENIKVTISATDNKQTTPTAHLYATNYKNTTTTGAVALNKISDDTATTTKTDAELTSQSSTYFLELNKYKPGYLLDYEPTATTSFLKYTNWAGSPVTITNVNLKNANRSIQWGTPNFTGTKFTYSTNAEKDLAATATTNVYADAINADGTVNVSGLYNSTNNVSGVVFKTTAATASTDAIDVTFSGNNGGKVTTSIKFSTERSDASIDDIYATVNGKKVLFAAGTNGADYTFTGLNTQIKNSGKIVVKAESDEVKFISVDPSIITIDEKTGEFKVLKKGNTKIQVYVGSTINNKPAVKTIDVTVSPWAYDEITVTSSNENAEVYGLNDGYYGHVDLDVPDSTAANAVKSVQLKAVSAGKLTTKWSSSDSSVATVDESTGLVTAKKVGTTKLTVTSDTNTKTEVFGTSETIIVTVWSLPAAEFTVAPITVNVGQSTLVVPDVKSPANYSYTVNYNDAAGYSNIYDLTNPGYTTNNNTQTTSRVTGDCIGTDKVQVTVIGTSVNRPTTKKATVTVLDKSIVNTITMDAGSQSLVLTEGETATLKATSSKSKEITFASADPTTATVTTAGAVTAVKAGQTTITAKSEGADDVIIPVVVVAKDKEVVYADPAKITGVKVSNKKGAKVTVKFTKDTTNSTMKYYVQKKVSGKTSGKSIGSTKTTLSVKKGATVKVRVKAYYYDANGKKHVGKYSAWKTLKTDKK